VDFINHAHPLSGPAIECRWWFDELLHELTRRAPKYFPDLAFSTTGVACFMVSVYCPATRLVAIFLLP